MTLKRPPRPGDKVALKTANELYTGTLMERPLLVDDNHLIIKLKSGYNAGIKKEDILEITVLEPLATTKKKKNKEALKKDSQKPNITLISTGGTISSRVDYTTGGVYAAFTAEDLLRTYPEIKKFANIKTINLMNIMSEDIHPSLWTKIATAAYSELNNPETAGVVITHGTDTLTYTSAALSFMLGNLSKPLALTGSQRSSDRGSADSFLNLLSSVIWASSKYSGVAVVMHKSTNDDCCLAHSGTRVRKMHTTRRDAFHSLNTASWAEIRPEGKIIPHSDPPRRSSQAICLKSKIEENVAFIKIHPGITPQIIDFYLDKKFKGMVFEGTALGHLPTTITDRSLIPAVERAHDAGVVMAMTSQCLYGRVNPSVYSNLREISSKGVIYCKDMLPETAFVKLSWLLGNYPTEKARNLLTTNLVGEISDKSPIDSVPPLNYL